MGAAGAIAAARALALALERERLAAQAAIVSAEAGRAPWLLLQIGLGGYVVGCSVEKISPQIANGNGHSTGNGSLPGGNAAPATPELRPKSQPKQAPKMAPKQAPKQTPKRHAAKR